MERSFPVAWLVFLGLTLSSVKAGARVDDRQARGYKVISSRNLFDLRAAPPMPVPFPTAVTELPRLILNGITTILPNKQVLLTAQFPARQAGAPTTEKGYILAEGRAQDGIEVLEIDEMAGVVVVVNSGRRMRLDFENHGARLSAAPAVPAAPTNSVAAGRMPYAMGTTHAPLAGSTLPAFPQAPGSRALPYRSHQPGFYSAATNTAAGLLTNALTAPPASPNDGLSVEERALLNDLQREAAQTYVPDEPVAPTPLTSGGTYPGVMAPGGRPPGTIPPQLAPVGRR